MMEDDNEFLDRLLCNFNVTENKMSETQEEPNTSNNREKMQPNVAGAISTGKALAGLAVLIFCEIIAVATKVDGEFGLASFIFIVGGLVASVAIWLKK